MLHSFFYWNATLLQVVADLPDMAYVAIRDMIRIFDTVHKEKGDVAILINADTANIVIVQPGTKAFGKVIQTAFFHGVLLLFCIKSYYLLGVITF